MKTGYYIRYVPSHKEFALYFFDGRCLFVLNQPSFWWLGSSLETYLNMSKLEQYEIIWQQSLHRKPLKKMGFEYVCNEVFE